MNLRQHKRRAAAGMARRFAMFGPPGYTRAILWGHIPRADWLKLRAAAETWPGELASVNWRRWSQSAYTRGF